MKIENFIITSSTISLYDSFYHNYNLDNDNTPDYKPLTKDKSRFNKIIFWLSQCTHQVNLIILFAYIAKALNQKNISNILLKIGFPNLCTVVILYWVLLGNKSPPQTKFRYYNIYLHLLVFPLCFYDVLLNHRLKFKTSDLKYTITYFLIATLSNIINFKLRPGVWTYGLFKFVKPTEDLTGYIYYIITICTSMLSHIVMGKIKLLTNLN